MVLFIEYLFKIIRHKWFVLIARRRFGVGLWQALVHDLLKLSPAEFFSYARYHMNPEFSDERDDELPRYVHAVAHHYHNNKHHPEHWVMNWRGPWSQTSELQPINDHMFVTPMPKRYVREFILDLHATGYGITGSWDISSFINIAGKLMHLHELTKRLIDDVMHEAGYTGTSLIWDFRLKEDDRETARESMLESLERHGIASVADGKKLLEEILDPSEKAAKAMRELGIRLTAMEAGEPGDVIEVSVEHFMQPDRSIGKTPTGSIPSPSSNEQNRSI